MSFLVNEANECREFLSSHMNAKVRLRKSMWAVITAFDKPSSSGRGYGALNPRLLKEFTLYTYDIEKMLKEDQLRILEEK